MIAQALLERFPVPAGSAQRPHADTAAVPSLDAGPAMRQESARLIRLRRECDVSPVPFVVLAAACVVLVVNLVLVP